jgi:hypothetical protein
VQLASKHGLVITQKSAKALRLTRHPAYLRRQLNRSNGAYRRGELIEVAVDVLVIDTRAELWQPRKSPGLSLLGTLRATHFLAVATWRRANGEHLSSAISSRHWQYLMAGRRDRRSHIAVDSRGFGSKQDQFAEIANELGPSSVDAIVAAGTRR